MSKTTLDEDRRFEALKLAIGHLPTSHHTPQSLVEAAKEFEAYLRGDGRPDKTSGNKIVDGLNEAIEGRAARSTTITGQPAPKAARPALLGPTGARASKRKANARRRQQMEKQRAKDGRACCGCGIDLAQSEAIAI